MPAENIDLGVLEENTGDTLDSIFSQIERLDLSEEIGPVKETIENELTYLERKLQDLGDFPNSFLNSSAIKASSEFLIAIKNLLEANTTPDTLKKVLPEVRDVNSILSHFMINDVQISKKDLIKNITKHTENVNNFNSKKRTNRFSRSSTRDYLEKLLKIEKEIHRISNEITNESKTYYVDVYIKDSKGNKNELYSLWLFIEILSQIKGVSVTLTQIQKSSIKAQLEIRCDNANASEDVVKTFGEVNNLIADKIRTKNPSNSHISGTPNLVNNMNIPNNSDYETEPVVISKSEIKVTNYDLELKKEELRAIKLANDAKELTNEALKIANDKARIENKKMLHELFIASRKDLVELFVDDIIDKEDFIAYINNDLQINYNSRRIE